MNTPELNHNRNIFNEYIKVWRLRVNDKLVNEFFIKFTYHSNKIVNTYITLEDVKTIFNSTHLTNFNGNQNTIKEIKNHKEVYIKYFKLDKKVYNELSVEIIKDFYYILMKDCCTKIMPIDEKKLYSLNIEKENSLALLVGIMRELKINDDNVLSVVSYFYCWLLKGIHPFICGNGRLGRMLVNYLLIINNFPPILFFENDREEYYLSLKYFSDTTDISKMVYFMEKQAYKTWVKNYHLKLKSLKEFLDE